MLLDESFKCLKIIDDGSFYTIAFILLLDFKKAVANETAPQVRLESKIKSQEMSFFFPK